MTNLKQIIDKKGVQQRWLAEQVGVTEVSMSRYVSGDRIPKAPMAIRMADVLGVDVKDLYGWDDEHVVGEPEQPEKRTEERTETHACDYISRQAAIDAILAVTGNSSVRELYEHVQEHGLSDMWSGGVNAAIDIIIAVPPAQPDMSEYSDKLWKAAYERGKAEALDEIIHCKDCKHWSRETICDGFCSEDCMRHDEDFYCRYAERKTNE